MMKRLGDKFFRALALGIVLLPALAGSAWAGGFGGGLPWEGPLQNLADSLTGPVARVIGIVAIFGAGIAVAFSEGGSSLRKILFVVLGLSIAFSAATWGLGFLGFGGGLLV